MKRVLFITFILFSVWTLQAQKETDFLKHEVRVSVGDAIWAQTIWTYESGRSHRNNANLYVNLSFSYFYRPVKWFWVGGNFVNYFGNKIDYKWREYGVDNSFRDFSKSKTKYCAVIAPEIRFSYFHRKAIILYSALSGGVCFENGFNSKRHKYPEINYFYHLTYFGFSCNLGKNNNIILGGELGAGMRGIGSIHCGYRF